MTGGQWPQVRLAKARHLETSDKCQLCHSATGTLLHRQECAIIKPNDGWGTPPTAAELFLQEMSVQRRDFLVTNGLAVIDLPLPAASENGQLRWLVAPDGGALSDALWYIDGSLLDGHYGSHGRVGFGILALGADDQILAAGYGTPPAWITTVPGAEAWALYAALRHSITAPGVVTDCMGVDVAAQRALSRVVSSRSPLGIAMPLGGCL